MSIERDGTWREIACDECGELTGDAYDQDEFGQMVSAAKRAGWQFKAIGGGWEHRCPDCQETPLQRAQRMFEEEKPRSEQEFAPDIEALLGRSRDHD